VEWSQRPPLDPGHLARWHLGADGGWPSNVADAKRYASFCVEFLEAVENPTAVMEVPHQSIPLLEGRRVRPKTRWSMGTLKSPCTGLRLDGRSNRRYH